MNIYQPHVYIDGVRLPEHAPVQEATPVARFEIKWGAADWFENVEPSKLTLTLLDPFGDFMQTGRGSRIAITRDPDDTPVWDGTIDEITSVYGQSTHPGTGNKRDMWTHRIIAYDPLQALAKDRRRGPLYPDRRASVGTHWGCCFMEDRKRDLDARSPVTIEWPPTFADFTDDYRGSFLLHAPVNGYELGQTVSALTVLRNTLRAAGVLRRPFYNPRTRTIFAPQHPIGTLIQNNGDASEIYLGSSDNYLQILDGSKFETSEAIQFSTSSRQSITQAEIGVRRAEITSDSDNQTRLGFTEVPFTASGAPDAESVSTVQAQIDIAFHMLEDENPALPPALRKSIKQLLADNVRDWITDTYGMPTLPQATYRFEKHAAAPAWAMFLLTPAPVPLTTYRFRASLTNLHPANDAFGIVGGLLSYTHTSGWKVTINPAGIRRRNLGGEPTLGDITQTAPLSAVTDNSLIADWQKLTNAR